MLQPMYLAVRHLYLCLPSDLTATPDLLSSDLLQLSWEGRAAAQI